MDTAVRTVWTGAWAWGDLVSGWYATWLERDVVEVNGQSATNFLQAQLYRDVLALRDGDSVWAWLLSRQRTADSFLRATRITETRWILDTDNGWGEALQDRLERGLGSKTVSFSRPQWKALRLVFMGMGPIMRTDSDLVVAWVHWWRWPPLGTIDLLGPDPVVPDDFPVVGPDEYESVRIMGWFPKMGSEITPATRPVETGLTEWSVWYEPDRDTAARQWLERPPPSRRLTGFRLAGPVETPIPLVDRQGKEIGVLTSNAFDRHRGWVGLGYLNSDVKADAIRAGTNGPAALVRREPG